MTGPDDSFSRRLWRTENVVDRAIDHALSACGLSSTLLGTLRMVVDDPGVSTAELARRAQVRPQSIAHAVGKLEDQGLVERRPHPVHGKILQVFPTPTAKSALRGGSKALRQAEDVLLGGLAPDERQALADLLDRVSRNARNNLMG
ncbi:MarR family winged helix-turn-helix transcriptional regulator [Mycolicibacterium sp. CBM1]